MIDQDKVSEILKNGGHLVMHKNDVERLKEAGEAGNKPPMFGGVKIIKDQTGIVEEGQVFAVRPGIRRVEFGFRETFKR